MRDERFRNFFVTVEDQRRKRIAEKGSVDAYLKSPDKDFRTLEEEFWPRTESLVIMVKPFG